MKVSASTMKAPRFAAALSVLCLIALGSSAPQPNNKLWEYRNLGKAFYENPDTHPQAVEALRSALTLAPDSVRERINYGLALLRTGKNDAAVSELLKAQQQDPKLPYSWFNLGIYYKHAGDYDKAAEELRGMIKLSPAEPIAHYNLGAVLRAKGDTDAALPEFLEAERLNPYLAGPHFQLFTIYQRMGRHEDAQRERTLFEEAKKRNEGQAVPEDMEWCFFAELYDPPDARPYSGDESSYDDHIVASDWTRDTHLLAIDSEGSGRADLLVWSKGRAVLYKRGSEAQQSSGLSSLTDIRSIAAGDYDNDGLVDLAVVTGAGVALYHNEHGRFAKAMDLPGTTDSAVAVWLDYDHDYDLDLLLFGPQSTLLRNNGDKTFTAVGAKFPFVNGPALDAVAFASRGDTAARDVLVSYADRPAIAYIDHLNEVFETQNVPAIPAGSWNLDAQDVNHDGMLDIVAYSPERHVALNDGGHLVAADKERSAPSSVRADFNGDGREDYATLTANGALHLFTNSSQKQSWSTVRITGVKNTKVALGATVEIKSGVFYEKRIYTGVPLAFALDKSTDADTVRITWPNGLIQNEIHEKANVPLRIEEAQRLSGSCPMIFAWDGKQFRFVTDVLGVAPLGASSGDGHYFPVDHDEYIQIPGASLQAVDGQYRIHITEELHEVSYLDKVQLIAVDHPSDTPVYTNDKFKSPPYPEFRLFGARHSVHAVVAREDDRVDVTDRLAAVDRRYPDQFEHNSAGVAKLHTLDLDFGSAAPDNHAALVLQGWVDWADGSTFLGASQAANGSLVFPYLQVKDERGEWKTVVEDMGIPSGKPKAIVVNLNGKFLSRSREVRIVTNLCVYWDEIFLSEDARAPQARLTALTAHSADLHFRGFSRAVIDPQRQQPEQFLYDQVSMTSSWNPTPGKYTRYGNVLPLVTDVDDRLTIMGSGDELSLTFSAKHLPVLPKGWTRDFLLLVDGWAKDADANTAFSQTVSPLPFHAMSAYPYQSSEHFPSDPAHLAYEHEYLTRPALRLIRPLAPERGLP